MPEENRRAFSASPGFSTGAVRRVKEYYEKVEYIHLNPVTAGLVQRAEDWPWSSVHDYSGSLSAAPIPNRTLTIGPHSPASR